MKYLPAITILIFSLLNTSINLFGQGISKAETETEQISFGVPQKDTLGKVILFMPDFTFTNAIAQVPKQHQPYVQAFSLFMAHFLKQGKKTLTLLEKELTPDEATLTLTDSLVFLDYGLWIRANNQLYLRCEFLTEGNVSHLVASLHKGPNGYTVDIVKKDKFSSYLSAVSSPAHFKLMNPNYKPVAVFQTISSRCTRRYFSNKPNLECLLATINDLDAETIKKINTFSQEARSKFVSEKFAQ
ncbi:MAG: hypothetical protein AB8H12_08350 [Lewinella sp.]